jgi:hypothetical protein
MTDSKSLDELEALLAKATAGEWEREKGYPNSRVHIVAGHIFVADTGMSNDNTAAIVAAVNWCRTEGIAAARERDRLRGALQFYADKEAWNQPPVKTIAGLLGPEYENKASLMQCDRGKIARTALAGQP